MRWVVLFVTINSSVGLAAGASPSFIAAPLDVRRAPSDEATTGLNRQLRILLMKEPGGVTPTPSMWDAAIAEHNRQDCAQNDDCLRQLAVTAGTLYAVYAAVELDLTRTNITAVGRIVRRDGVLVQIAGEDRFQVVMPLQQRPFNLAALAALTELVKQMRLSALPATLPANAVVDVKPPPEVKPTTAPQVVITAPVAPDSRPVVGKVLLGAGAGIAVVGGVLALVGQVQAGGLTPVDGSLPPEQVGAWRAAVTLRPVGVAMLGAGAAVAIAGTLIWALAPKTPGVRVALLPRPEGVSLTLAGEFP